MPHRHPIIASFRHALHGIASVARREQNFRIHLSVCILVVIAAITFRVQWWEWIALVVAAVLVLVVECVNSAIEWLLDLLEPRLHSYAREVKDAMAAAVFIATLGAVIVGIVVFLPRIAA